ncbi:3838_t:CDS:1, partial [Dentiscutata erythropus]
WEIRMSRNKSAEEIKVSRKWLLGNKNVSENFLGKHLLKKIMLKNDRESFSDITLHYFFLTPPFLNITLS